VGRLAGFSYRQVLARLRQLGFVDSRPAKGCHEVWRHRDGRYAVLTRHPGDIPEGTLRAILRQAGIDPDDFLA